MSVAFDPYHKWLGIPPAQQPPTYYRLLGVELFESDRDVIDAAANQRMVYLQDLAGGEHGAHSQKLLNEVSAARRCLLNPTAKADYDQKLRTAVSAPTPAPSVSPWAIPPMPGAAAAPLPVAVPVPEFLPVAVPMPVAMPVPEGLNDATIADSPPLASLPQGTAEFAGLDLSTVPAEPAPEPRKRSSTRLTIDEESPAPKRKLKWIAAGVVLLAGVGGAVALAISGKDEPKVVQAVEEKRIPTPPPTKAPPKKIEPPAKVNPKPPEKNRPTTPPVPAPPVEPPVFHFAPAGRNLSELCDVVLLGSQYHLFYCALVPNKQGERSWGHAVSSDLLTWKPSTIKFSGPAEKTEVPTRPGCVVLDEANSSGLSTDGKPALVAVLRSDTGGKDPPALRLASSKDDGVTWTYEAASTKLPLKLPEGKPELQSYRVMYHRPAKTWLLAFGYNFRDGNTGRSVRSHAAVFSSTDLRGWSPLNHIGLPDASGLADLFLIPLNKNLEQSKLVVITQQNQMKFAEFDEKGLRWPTTPWKTTWGSFDLEESPISLELNTAVNNARVFAMDDKRLGIINLMGQRNSQGGRQAPILATLPVELQLQKKERSARTFVRTFLDQYKAFAGANKPEPAPSATLEKDENGFKGLAPQLAAAKGLFDLEFELQHPGKKPATVAHLRGTKLAFDGWRVTFGRGDRNGPTTFAALKTGVKVRVISDRRSLEIWINGTHSYSMVIPDAAAGPDAETSLTGEGTVVKGLTLKPLLPPPAAALTDK